MQQLIQEAGGLFIKTPDEAGGIKINPMDDGHFGIEIEVYNMINGDDLESISLLSKKYGLSEVCVDALSGCIVIQLMRPYDDNNPFYFNPV